MKCPYCCHEELKVTDSRSAGEMSAIRRRRECLSCGKRFTTFETVDLSLQVLKRNGRYEDFELEKLIKGIDTASRHTRISHDQARDLASSIVSELFERQVREINAIELGEIVMKRLCSLDPVAYIRFACVFKDADEIIDAIKTVTDRGEHTEN